MDTQDGTEFVTVVSVQGGAKQPPPSASVAAAAPSPSESFITVLSIGQQQQLANGIDPAHPEEEVEVYRLPGERLGFGLKFEGGNKTSERVRRLFIQSCAEQSPASRATCSWGHLGEGDEVLLIDGVSVTQMTRLDCVRRLKESQLVIKLMVRCRGALRPEVVSAERKEGSKVPPELPSAPPPVPPRKLRHSQSQTNRGSADGEASPGSKQSWDSPKSTGSSQTGSPRSVASFRSAASSVRSSNYDSCNSSPAKIIALSKSDSPKGSPKVHMSPVLNKSKQELSPAEAQLYLDARSQDGSSTHGSASDDTSSSLSTVIDRLDRFSTTSTMSTTSEQFFRNSPELTTNGVDFLLSRLANSEARTYVESHGDVERVTAVVAPNTVLIEETPTLQPPLSFQDAPLSYGHEPRPGIFYSADLAADSRTHFRPIKDDADVVEKVVNGHEVPPLPVKNHVNRIPIVQEEEHAKTPVLPPKPMPRKDVRAKRKRPPPPPPPPRREPMPIPEARILDTVNDSECENEIKEEAKVEEVLTESSADNVDDNEIEINTKDENANEHQTNKILELVDMKIQNSFSRTSDDENEVAERENDDSVDVEMMNSINRNLIVDNEMVDEEKVEQMMMEQIVKEHNEPSDESDDGDDYYWQSNLATIGEEEENNSLEYEDVNEVPSSVDNKQSNERSFEEQVIKEYAVEHVPEVIEKKGKK
ncbi:uncharacterized protein LOC131662983 [Phymastichus coffea]|uniref:uncharacterized protein LOC131662983 n=1 Tax=Phymastichus coffea TaxID=108790 RepID=UPI00273C4A09|nr:uncharacterized protein LOC131662983 [Phymastichus coffea]